MKAVIAETAETMRPMMRVSEWLKDKGHKPGDDALRIADEMGLSDLNVKSRHSAPRSTRGVRQRSSFGAMVIAEWHKLVADVSRAFARKRIHRAAAESRQINARVRSLRAPKETS